MGITKYDKFERFVHAIFFGFIDVSDEICWRRFGHQHPLSFYISVRYQHWKDVTNIEILSPISKNRIYFSYYFPHSIFLFQIGQKIHFRWCKFFKFLAKIIDFSINYTLSICHHFVAINFDASIWPLIKKLIAMSTLDMKKCDI